MSHENDDPYWDWVRDEALQLGSDGCTFVSEWNQYCCLEHDLACAYGKSPRSAYQHHLSGAANPWMEADEMSRRDADGQFRSCNLSSHSKIKYTRGWVRWLGVRLGAFIGVGKKRKK